MFQANQHHARGASTTLCRVVCKVNLALVQELWLIGGCIRGSCKLIYDRIGSAPGAALLVDNSVRHFLLTNFILRDLVAMVIEVATAVGGPGGGYRLCMLCLCGNVNVMPMNWSHGVNKRGESLSD